MSWHQSGKPVQNACRCILQSGSYFSGTVWASCQPPCLSDAGKVKQLSGPTNEAEHARNGIFDCEFKPCAGVLPRRAGA